VVTTTFGRHDVRAHHTLKDMVTYHMLARLEHFNGFHSFSSSELELLRRQLQQMVLVINDVLDERR
jgi:hypothetical protein